MKVKSMIAAVAASALAIGAMAVPASADAADLANITGVTFYISCPQATDPEIWYGGAFGTSSNKNNWKTVQWTTSEEDAAEHTDKVLADKIDDTHFKVTYTENLFTGEEEWAQAIYQAYGADDTVLEKVYLDGVDLEITEFYGDDYKQKIGYILGDSDDGTLHGVLNAAEGNGDEGETTTTTEQKESTTTTTTKKPNGTPTTNTKTDSTKTGDAGVGVAVAALSLAGAAAFVARKKH